MPSKSQQFSRISQIPRFALLQLRSMELKKRGNPVRPPLLWPLLPPSGPPTFPEATAQQSPLWKTGLQTQGAE